MRRLGCRLPPAGSLNNSLHPEKYMWKSFRTRVRLPPPPPPKSASVLWRLPILFNGRVLPLAPRRNKIALAKSDFWKRYSIDSITEKLRAEKPQGCEVLAAWLVRAKENNGFYILGL